MTRRATPCERCRAIYTFHGVCDNCSGSGAEDPPPVDRWADLSKAARTVTTPETRRAANVHLGPDGATRTVVGFTESGGVVTATPETRRARAELPTLDAIEQVPVEAPGGRLVGYATSCDVTRGAEPSEAFRENTKAVLAQHRSGELKTVSLDRHVAINKLIGFVTAEGTTDSAVAALLSEAERLKGAA